MPFASPADMAARSQGQITEATHPFLRDELAAASRRIRAFCGWHVAPLAELVLLRQGVPERFLWLPAMKLAGPPEIYVDGVLSTAPVTYNPDTGFLDLLPVADGLSWIGSGPSWPSCSLEVRYSAGHDPIPEDLTVMCLGMAARGLGSPLGHTRESAGSVSVTFSAAGAGVAIAAGSQLLDHEKGDLWASYKLVGAP
jgi:hypothetical protein